MVHFGTMAVKLRLRSGRRRYSSYRNRDRKPIDLQRSLTDARLRLQRDIKLAQGRIKQIDKALEILAAEPEFHALLKRVMEVFLNNRW